MVFGKMNDLVVIYEDNHIIVVVKPENVLSQSDSSGDIDLLTMVKSYIKEKHNKPGNVYVGLIHRLDRPVGGIMVFAKTSKAAKRLNEQIKNGNFKKTYVLICEGHIENKADTLINYLYKDEKLCVSKVVNENHPGAKLSKLEYEVINYIDNKTIVKVNLLTGRHHQIRLQFSNMNHPICGDVRYGSKSNFNLRLYAYKLEFKHPVKNEFMEFIKLPSWEEIKNETTIH
ncbi:MAG: RluA family pseudouridine synthase [Bacilli bacterium]